MPRQRERWQGGGDVGMMTAQREAAVAQHVTGGAEAGRGGARGMQHTAAVQRAEAGGGDARGGRRLTIHPLMRGIKL